MATIKLHPDRPIPNRPPASHMLCFGSIEWRADLGGAMVRNISDALAVQHWQYQSFLDQESGKWVEVAAPMQVDIELELPVSDGDLMRTTFFLVPTGVAKQSVRASVKPGVRWVSPGGQLLGPIRLDPPELFFAARAKRLLAIRLLAG